MDWALQSGDGAIEQVLLCAARLHAVDFAAQLVMMLTAPSTQKEGMLK